MGLMGLYSKEKSIMYIYNKVMVMKKDTFMIQLCNVYTYNSRKNFKVHNSISRKYSVFFYI